MISVHEAPLSLGLAWWQNGGTRDQVTRLLEYTDPLPTVCC